MNNKSKEVFRPTNSIRCVSGFIQGLVPDQNEVVALREAREAQDAAKQRRVTRTRKSHSTDPSSSSRRAACTKSHQKTVRMSGKMTVNLINAGANSSENGWHQEPKSAAKEEDSEEEHTEINAILGSPTARIGQNLGKRVAN
jgi:hypothetical protein